MAPPAAITFLTSIDKREIYATANHPAGHFSKVE
jgi:hypothetical protein